MLCKYHHRINCTVEVIFDATLCRPDNCLAEYPFSHLVWHYTSVSSSCDQKLARYSRILDNSLVSLAQVLDTSGLALFTVTASSPPHSTKEAECQNKTETAEGACGLLALRHRPYKTKRSTISHHRCAKLSVKRLNFVGLWTHSQVLGNNWLNVGCFP